MPRSRRKFAREAPTVATSASSRSIDNTTMSAVVGDAYFSLKTLSIYSGLSVRTLRGCLSDAVHPLANYRVGGKILVRRSEFDAWVRHFKRTCHDVPIDALVDDVISGLR